MARDKSTRRESSEIAVKSKPSVLFKHGPVMASRQHGPAFLPDPALAGFQPTDSQSALYVAVQASFTSCAAGRLRPNFCPRPSNSFDSVGYGILSNLFFVFFFFQEVLSCFFSHFANKTYFKIFYHDTWAMEFFQISFLFFFLSGGFILFFPILQTKSLSTSTHLTGNIGDYFSFICPRI